MSSQLLQIVTGISTAVLPVLLTIVGAAVIASIAQTGALWVPNAVLPQLNRLNPTRAFGRWWETHTWVRLLGTALKLSLLMAVLFFHVRSRLSSAGPLVEGSPLAIFDLSGRLLGELAISLSLALVSLAILDYGYQFWRHEQQLMMTVEEVRRESREDQGDPKFRNRRNAASQGATRGTSQKTNDVDAVRPV